jgi:hypothetical protein
VIEGDISMRGGIHCLVARALVLLLAAGLLVGCRFPSELFFAPEIPPPSQIFTPTAANTPVPGTPEPTSTPETPTPFPCAYVNAEQQLPKETARLQDAINKIGLSRVEALAVAYGENCVDTLNNTVVSFQAIETDFYFTAVVDDRDDQNALGVLTARLLTIVKDFPPGDVPGPNLGYLTVIFQDGEGQYQLRVRLEAAHRAVENGLTGSVLMQELTSLQ